MAFMNGGAIMDEIPVANRDDQVQIAFRDHPQQPRMNQCITNTNPDEVRDKYKQ